MPYQLTAKKIVPLPPSIYWMGYQTNSSLQFPHHLLIKLILSDLKLIQKHPLPNFFFNPQWGIGTILEKKRFWELIPFQLFAWQHYIVCAKVKRGTLEIKCVDQALNREALPNTDLQPLHLNPMCKRLCYLISLSYIIHWRICNFIWKKYLSDLNTLLFLKNPSSFRTLLGLSSSFRSL